MVEDLKEAGDAVEGIKEAGEKAVDEKAVDGKAVDGNSRPLTRTQGRRRELKAIDEN